MPQLDSTWFASQLFWLFITFAVLYVLISRVMLPSLLKMMEHRKTTIDSDIANSESLKGEAQQAKEIYEQALKEARTKSRQLIDGVMQEHQVKSDQAKQELADKVAAKLAEAEKSIAAKREEFLSELKPLTADIAEAIANKLTNKTSTNKAGSA